MKNFLVQLRTVFAAELKMHLRDRRALGSAISLPLLAPILFAGMLIALASWTNKDRPLEVPVVGAQHAPGLVDHLERAGVIIVDAPEDPEARVLDGTLDVVLVIPEDYAEHFSSARPARVQLILDASRNASQTPVRRLQDVLNAYAGQVAAQRLLLRGVSPQVVQPLVIDELDLATPEKLAATLLHTMVIFLIIGAFSCGTAMATDTMAGERERGSLESLLLNPVDRLALVVGKWGAVVAVLFLMELLMLVGFSIATRFVPLQDLGVKLVMGQLEFAQIALILVPLTLFAAALELLISTFARSFKEAQTYLTLAVMLPMLPSMILTFRPVEPAAWQWAVPALAQDQLITGVLRGDGLPALGMGFSFLVCAALAAACLFTCARMMADSRILFGGAR